MIFNSLRFALVISGVIAFFYYGSGIKEDDHPVVFFTVTLIISFALMYVVERAKEKKGYHLPKVQNTFFLL